MYKVRIGKIYKDKRGYFRGDVVLDNGIEPIRKSFSAKKKYDLIEKKDEWIEKYKDLYLDPFTSNTLGNYTTIGFIQSKKARLQIILCMNM